MYSDHRGFAGGSLRSDGTVTWARPDPRGPCVFRRPLPRREPSPEGVGGRWSLGEESEHPQPSARRACRYKAAEGDYDLDATRVVKTPR